MSSVYLSTENDGEIIPLIAESLVLYDNVVLDLSSKYNLAFLADFFDPAALDYLLDNGILQFVYKGKGAPAYSVQAVHKKALLSKIVFLKVDSFSYENIERTIGKRYSRGLLTKIKDNIRSIEIDDAVLEKNCKSDLHNRPYMDFIFGYVKERLGMPALNVETSDDGYITDLSCIDNWHNTHEAFSWATLGLNIIAESNLRLAMLGICDCALCEKEYEGFYRIKFDTVDKAGNAPKGGSLLQLRNIPVFPDIRGLVGKGLLNSKDILLLREKYGKHLSEWFYSAKSSRSLPKTGFYSGCMKILLQKGFNSDLPLKPVSTGALKLLSMKYEDIPKLFAGTSQLIVPKCLRGWEPQLVFDSTREIFIKD